jgi:hypothetical protein
MPTWLSLARAADTEPAKAASQPTLQPVPQELFAQYVQAIKGTPEYALAKAYDPKQVREAVEKWGYKLRLENTRPFWGWLIDERKGAVTLPNGDKAHLRLEIRQGNGSVILEVAKEGTAAPVLYVVSPSKLDNEVMGFTIVSSLNVLEPSLVPIETFSVENQNMADVVRELCRRGNLDSSFRADMARSVFLTMNLKSKSVVDCFAMISRTTGWKVAYLYNEDFFDKMTPGFEVPVLRDKGRIEPGANPMDVLEKAFDEAMQPQYRPVVVFTAPGEASVGK